MATLPAAAANTLPDAAPLVPDSLARRRSLLQLGSAPINRTVAGGPPLPPSEPLLLAPPSAVPNSTSVLAPPGSATLNSAALLGAIARPGVGVLLAPPPPPPPMGPGSVDLDEVEGSAVFVVSTLGAQINATEAGEQAYLRRAWRLHWKDGWFVCLRWCRPAAAEPKCSCSPTSKHLPVEIPTLTTPQPMHCCRMLWSSN